MVLESQLPLKNVNLLYSKLIVNNELTNLWGSRLSKIIKFIHYVRRAHNAVSRKSRFSTVTLQQQDALFTLEATQGQIDGSFSQLLYQGHQTRVASVGD